MPGNRDLDILKHMLQYCRQIDTAHSDFGHDQSTFFQSTTYQNAVCMCILQIGELVGKLTDAYKEAHPEIPWSRIRGMRNFVAHEYGHLDVDVVWYTATKSVPALRAYCEQQINEGPC